MKKVSLILVIILIASCLGSGVCSIAFAASETIYTDVLEDLSKDETFNVENVKAEATEQGNPEMYVFQIAESNTRELFVYVFQQSEHKYTASEIRISTSIGDNLSPKDYKLTLLSRNGTLSKYKVNDFAVLSDAVRYYVIVQIARLFDKSLGDTNTGDNDIDTVAYEVGKQFTACTVDGNVTYNVEVENTITIIDKRIGYLRYTETSPLLSYVFGCDVGQSLDSHYVAFATNKPIDKLYEIEISYITAYYEGNALGSNLKRTEKLSETYYADNYINADLMQEHFTWKRIISKNDFVNNEPNLEDDDKSNLSNMQWVLRFYESDYGAVMVGMVKHTYWTRVNEVTILRLKFDLRGQIYNLGVVDNKQSEKPDQEPDNKPDNIIDRLQAILDKITDFFAWLGEHWWVLLVVFGVALLIVFLAVDVLRKGLGVVLKAIGKGLWYLLKYTFMGIGYIFASPILLIMFIMRKAKERKG